MGAARPPVQKRELGPWLWKVFRQHGVGVNAPISCVEQEKHQHVGTKIHEQHVSGDSRNLETTQMPTNRKMDTLSYSNNNLFYSTPNSEPQLPLRRKAHGGDGSVANGMKREHVG